MKRKAPVGEHFSLENIWSLSTIRGNIIYISLSIAKVEYIVATSCSTQVIWMKKSFKYLQEPKDRPMAIMCDYTNANSISKNIFMH